MDLDGALLVERHVAEWLRVQAVVPGVELHDDPDIVWVVHPGRAWSNAGVMIRLAKRSAASRVDTLVDRYRAHRRGMGLWVSPARHTRDAAGSPESARPSLPQALSRDAARPVEDDASSERHPPAVTIRPVTDVDRFQTTPHPSIGPLTTPLRRAAFESLRAIRQGRAGPVSGVCRLVGRDGGRRDAGLSGNRVCRAQRRRRARSASRPRHRRRARGSFLPVCGGEGRIEHRAAGHGHGTAGVRAMRLLGSRAVRVLVSELSAPRPLIGRRLRRATDPHGSDQPRTHTDADGSGSAADTHGQARIRISHGHTRTGTNPDQPRTHTDAHRSGSAADTHGRHGSGSATDSHGHSRIRIGHGRTRTGTNPDQQRMDTDRHGSRSATDGYGGPQISIPSMIGQGRHSSVA